MQRIFLKPTSQEVIIKGTSQDGHTDVFAYDYYDDDDKRKLGSLYVIGNVKQDDDSVLDASKQNNSPDIAYVVNLVASLAKREYYSRLDISSREAFSATLKKINDVVEEFFKNKSLKVNIGIFAIAGEQILISKLGKFKIILGRPANSGENSRIVDILNNIDLFSKERVEEKEFSNIISGKIMLGDKIFAFYPSRLIAARERFIKTDLLKLDGKQFVEKFNSIKETRSDFNCVALYLSLDNHKEMADTKKPKLTVGAPPTTSHSDTTKPVSNNQKDKKEMIANQETNEEVPRIISSEFALGRKVNPLFALTLIPIRLIKGLHASWVRESIEPSFRQKINLKRKLIVLSLITGILVTSITVIKTFIIINPKQRQLNTVVKQTQNNLKLVKTKIGQNDFISARQLLADSLSSIYAIGVSNDHTKKTTSEIYEILDNIDGAIDTSPSLLESMPDGLNHKISVITAQKEKLSANEYNITASPVAFDVYENNLYVLMLDNILRVADINQSSKKEASLWLKSGTLPSQSSTLAVDGKIYIIGKSGTLATYYKGEKVSEVNTFLVSNDNDVLLTSKDSDKLYLVNKLLTRIYELDKASGSLLKTLKVGSSEPFIDAYFSDTSTIIITTKDGRIWEIK